jgi:N-acetylmuramoyl-L-alanine amidase
MAKVFLSAGHGGSDPGACAYGLKEKNINLQIMLACRDELVRHGVTVVCSRTKDENDTVQQEVKEANASRADLAFSIHTNAGGGDGFEAFYYSGNSKGKKLAQLCEKYVRQLGQNSRGCKTNNLMFTRETTMTAVLVENFFVDNDTDNNIGDTVAEQKKFGVAYAKAILEYLGIKYKATTTSTTSNKTATTSKKTYRVQIGAYSDKANAEAMLKKVHAAGFKDALIKES